MSQKNFLNSVLVKKPNGSSFDLSFNRLTTLDMGYLVPTMCEEAMPGDAFKISHDSLLRFQPLIAPPMNHMRISHHTFFVPFRILWPNWEKYITNGGDDPATYGDPLPAHPFMTVAYDRSDYTKLLDYLDIPDPATCGGANTNMAVSAFPMAAYQMIWNEYYRDENLQDKIDPTLVDGDNSEGVNGRLHILRRRAWQKDLFTAALPFAQKGQPVELPVASFEDVPVKVDQNDYPDPDYYFQVNPDPDTVRVPSGLPSDPSAAGYGLYALTSTLSVDAVTINDLRTAFRLQEWLEKSARGGTRYTESLKIHYGVNSQDSRLQRPEYINGSVSTVTVGEVLNTTGTVDAPQGAMAGHAMAANSSSRGYYRVKEHGLIMTLTSVTPEAYYIQGLPKMYKKIVDPKQYLWPEFAHLGEQPVTLDEVFAFQADGDNEFGYQRMYYEYCYINNKASGGFRNDPGMIPWGMPRVFGAVPALNSDFIQCNPTKDIFAVVQPDIDSLILHMRHNLRAFRLLPKYGTPTF